MPLFVWKTGTISGEQIF